jgi:hypothetical protein
MGIIELGSLAIKADDDISMNRGFIIDRIINYSKICEAGANLRLSRKGKQGTAFELRNEEI